MQARPLSPGPFHESPEICANVIIGLIKVATYLLYKQLLKLEQEFLNNGGLRERMTQARLATRKGYGR
jgi:four helix bundle suffix protein